MVLYNYPRTSANRDGSLSFLEAQRITQTYNINNGNTSQPKDSGGIDTALGSYNNSINNAGSCVAEQPEGDFVVYRRRSLLVQFLRQH